MADRLVEKVAAAMWENAAGAGTWEHVGRDLRIGQEADARAAIAVVREHIAAAIEREKCEGSSSHCAAWFAAGYNQAIRDAAAIAEGEAK